MKRQDLCQVLLNIIYYQLAHDLFPSSPPNTQTLFHSISKHAIACCYTTEDEFLKKLCFACMGYPQAQSTEDAHGCTEQQSEQLLLAWGSQLLQVHMSSIFGKLPNIHDLKKKIMSKLSGWFTVGQAKTQQLQVKIVTSYLQSKNEREKKN